MASRVIKKIFSSPKSPQAIGPYSQAVQTGNLLFLSGQIGLDPTMMQLVEGGIKAETQRALENIGHVLEAAGLSFKNVVKTTVLLADINDFVAMNEVYAKFFTEEPPARVAYEVANLPKNGRVEIDAIAVMEN